MKNNSVSEPIPAVGVICFKGDRVLLIKRSKPPKAGDWSLPGGHIEPGETRREAALRELLEETGVTAKLLDKVATIDADFGTHHYILHDYLALWESGKVLAGDDAADARLFTLDEIAALGMWPKAQSVILDAWKILQSQS